MEGTTGGIPDTEKVEGPGGDERKPAAAGRSRRLPVELPVFIFYFLVSAFLTWPLIIRFSSSVYGYPADNLGGTWLYWWWRNAGQLGGSSSFCPLIGFPFGAHMSAMPLDMLSVLSERFLLLFMNEVVVFNLEILASFFLSGITMYYLVRYLTKDGRAALFGGFAYLIIPYHAYHAMYMGGGLIEVQWMPLYILLLLKFIRQPTWKRTALLAVGALLVAGTSVHNGLFMAIFTAAFLVGRFAHRCISGRKGKGEAAGRPPLALNRKTLVLSLLVVLIVVVAVLPTFYLAVSKQNPAGKWPTSLKPFNMRSGKVLYWGAAQPRDYFLPNNSARLFSSLKAGSVVKSLDWYSSLYIGWVIIVLAALCIFLRPGKRREDQGEGPRAPAPEGEGRPQRQVGEPEAGQQGGEPDAGQPEALRPVGRDWPAPPDGAQTGHVIWGFALAALVCFLFSIKPYFHIGSVKIPLPSTLFRFFTPWFRWYMRTGVVVVLCMIVLACFGLSSLLSRLKRLRWEFVLVPLMLLLALELIIVPPFQNYSFAKTPELFKKVSKLPEGSALAFYPLVESGLFTTSELFNQQRVTRKPMLNGAYDNSDGEALRRTVFNPYQEATPRILRRFGIGYSVFNKKDYDINKLPSGFELVESFHSDGFYGDSYLFKVTAPAAGLVPLYLGDISVPNLVEGDKTKRMLVRKGIIRIINHTGGETYARVSIPIDNPRGERTVVVNNGEAVCWRGRISEGHPGLAEIESLRVPLEGIELKLVASGDLVELSDGDISAYGTDVASLTVGDVIIQQQ